MAHTPEPRPEPSRYLYPLGGVHQQKPYRPKRHKVIKAILRGWAILAVVCLPILFVVAVLIFILTVPESLRLPVMVVFLLGALTGLAYLIGSDIDSADEI